MQFIPYQLLSRLETKNSLTICARYTKHFKRMNGLVPVLVSSSIAAQCKRKKIHARIIRGGGKSKHVFAHALNENLNLIVDLLQLNSFFMKQGSDSDSLLKLIPVYE